MWSVERNLYRCAKCHTTAYCTRRLLECIPVPSPPQGETPYFSDKLHSSHILWDITRQDNDPLWFCSRCGNYAYKRIKNLEQPCDGLLKERTPACYRLQLLRGGSYPNTKKFWAQPKLAVRSIKGYPADLGLASKPVQEVTSCKPPAAQVGPPAMFHVDMEALGHDMWSEFDDHMAQGAAESRSLISPSSSTSTAP